MVSGTQLHELPMMSLAIVLLVFQALMISGNLPHVQPMGHCSQE